MVCWGSNAAGRCCGGWAGVSRSRVAKLERTSSAARTPQRPRSRVPAIDATSQPPPASQNWARTVVGSLRAMNGRTRPGTDCAFAMIVSVKSSQVGPLLLSHLLLPRGHVGQHLRRVTSRWNPSVISAHSLTPLLASGAHSIGCRMVVCCLCIDLYAQSVELHIHVNSDA